MKKLFRLITFLVVISFGNSLAMVPDLKLEKRLVEEKRYIIKQGDTWSQIAYKVYGHRSWWQRLQKKNRGLSNFKKNAKLPIGSEVWYRAPRIGRVYEVQANDTFTRILEWKYGGTKKWLKVLRLNRNKMRKYSKIEAGDRFEFLYSGRVAFIKKGVVIDTREKQALESKVYKTVEGDTPRLIAYRVYGHKSWWSKVVDQNSKIKNAGAYQKIPVGTKLLYQGPIIGSSYKVQEGDTLSRIALWKYGNFKLWSKIAKHNKELLANPDLIRVGDRILLKGLGGISIVKKPATKSSASAPIVLKTPTESSKELIPLPPVVAKVAPAPSKWKPILTKVLRFLPILILIVVVGIVGFLLVKVSRDIIKKRAVAADKKFSQNLSSQKPISAQKSKMGPKLFNKLQAVMDEGEYSEQVGYPELSRKVKFGRIFRSRKTS